MSGPRKNQPEQFREIERLWRPEIGLRFREVGDRGMILEQLFVGTAFGQPTLTEWRPVPVVPESEVSKMTADER